MTIEIFFSEPNDILAYSCLITTNLKMSTFGFILYKFLLEDNQIFSAFLLLSFRF